MMRVALVRSGVPVSPQTARRQRSGRLLTSGVETPSSSRTAHEERLEESAAFSNLDSPPVEMPLTWSLAEEARQMGTWHSSTMTRSYTKYSRGTPLAESGNRF